MAGPLSTQGTRAAEFLNVDLDLAGPGVGRLAAAFGEQLVALHLTKTEGVFELLDQPRSVEAAILRVAELVEALPKDARALWAKCRTRTFNVGVQCAVKPGRAALTLAVSRSAVARVERLRADLVLTVYPAP